MSVTVETNFVQYDGDDATQEFAFTFPLVAKTDLVVEVADEDGVVTELTQDVDYTIEPTNGNNDYSGGGTITTTATYTTTDVITLTRTLAFTQSTIYEEGDPFPAKTHERALDRLTMLIQQVKSSAPVDLLASLEEVDNYDEAEIQILGHYADGSWGWFTASVEE